ncbi:MAG TPA: MOSC domain-containing protein [Povalibacter sp.]|nr:MOSC domain-containing protein [Povalibacter sp.]
MMLSQLLASLPQVGAVRWIGVRPARRVAPIAVDVVEARPGAGLTGDRFSGGTQSKRQVTLIQAEHLAVVAQLLQCESIDPALIRRNIVVSGINLLAFNGAVFRIGGAVFEGTGGCHPCSRMEEALGSGGYNAMRGHGGITARVLEGGLIRLGDEVRLLHAGQLAAVERE